MYLANLSAGLELLFQHTSDDKALAEAVRTAREAVDATPPDDSSRMMRLSNLSNSLRTMYLRTGDFSALVDAVEAGERAVRMLDGPGDEASRLLSNLANARWDLAQHRDDPVLRAEAVATFQEAFDATPEHHPNRPGILSNLADRRGMVATDAVEAEIAVELARQALAWTDEPDPDRAHNESCLAATLRTCYNHTGDVRSLVEAAILVRSALFRTRDDHARTASRLVEFGNTLRAVHERTGELALAVQAAEATSQAVAITSVEEPARVGYLINAANALLVLYERTDDVVHVRKAVEFGRKAVDELGTDHPSLLGTLTQLIAPMVALASVTNDEELFAEAVAIGRRVTTLPDDHPDVIPACSNAAHALLRRHAHTDDPQDADEAARYARRAAELTPRGSAHRPSILNNLGATQLLANLHDEARATFLEVTMAPAATVLDRVRAWRYLGRVEMSVDDPGAALAAFEQAVVLLPQLTPQRSLRADREFGLGKTTGLAAETAAAAVRADWPDRGVELVEQARTLLMSETLDARSDLRMLRDRHPELHREFQHLREALDAADHPVVADFVGVPPAARREELVTQWTTLLDRVRAHPGLGTFLLPQPPRVDQGPMVITYATRWGSGALVLRPGQPVDVVPLPGITDITAAEQADRFEETCLAAARAPSYRARKAALDDMHVGLRWLWDNVTAPVLDQLGFDGPDDGNWPRVWWCPISAMSSLPLHAAGYHEDGSHRTALDRVVSSYTTSLRSHARRPRPTAGTSALVVSMPETPGEGALPSAASEVEAIIDLLPGSATLTRDEARRAAVVEALPRHPIAHVACHAIGDSRDPGASRLLLHDHEDTALTVADIAELDLPDADLAFLSACNTTDTAPRLVDEAVHITGAFHLAGYRHVIGTLTPVNATAARVAAAVYGFLTDGGTVAPDCAQTALALHHAVRLIREDHVDAPHTWAAWIHVGI
jgi:tetratricopeptide (TPR) repeat protein